MEDKKEDLPQQMSERSERQLQSEVLCYMGKTLKKQGEKDGKTWKLWALQFDAGGKFPWKCSAFDGLGKGGLTLKDLLEGEYYEVVYKTDSYVHPSYGNIQTKQAVVIKKSSKDKATNGKTAQNQAVTEKTASLASFQPAQFDRAKWEQFAIEYNEAMKDNPLISAMHMLGAYIANNKAEEFKDLIEACQNHFGKKASQ